MEIIKAMVYGLVQGLTEFLPISSSGHLVILHRYSPLPITDEIAFDVALHAATLLAVIWYFRRELVKIFVSAARTVIGRDGGETGHTGIFIVYATIPAALAGFFGADFIDEKFRTVGTVAFMLVLVGLFIILIERFGKKTKNLDDLKWRDVLLIGLGQALALIPGTSRSGITIIAAMALGFKREAAVKFSFLLSVPIIAGASVKNFSALLGASLQKTELLLFAAAFVTAALAGWFAIKFLLRFAERHSLSVFGFYRLVLAALLISFLV